MTSNSGRDTPPMILLAGGGTGGHIYPNVAIAEGLRSLGTVRAHFLVSDRPGDAKTMQRLGETFTASPTRPLPSPRHPGRVLTFAVQWRRAIRQVTELLRSEGCGAVVTTGGFVSGPAMVAAARLGLPRALVNLDAVPGIANRQLARLATAVFSTSPTPHLPSAIRIGLPLRRVSVSRLAPERARAQLGLRPELPTVFITGATHGAESLTRAIVTLAQNPRHATMFRGWQIFHQCGTLDAQELQRTYDAAGVTARVVDYCDEMGVAYAAADVVVSRAGAGSVAEAWANAAPTVFLPNPYHKDQHQRLNAEPMAECGGAVLVQDRVDPVTTIAELAPVLRELMDDPQRRVKMRHALTAVRPPDGAAILARWLIDHAKTDGPTS